MVWSVISSKGPGPLYFVEGTMNSAKYKSVLQNKLMPQLGKWFKGTDNCTFMQDGAPCHTAKCIYKYLEYKKVKVLDWPGNSPDMNPIENVWDYLKKEVAKSAPTTKEKLVAVLNSTWRNSPNINQMIQSCINSMPRRIDALLQVKGKHTKY